MRLKCHDSGSRCARPRRDEAAPRTPASARHRRDLPPETERDSHYYEACLPEQFDALIHLDETRALEPLERNSEWEQGELPETYPEGL